ncbi:hypothetical protein BJX63DRAFT_16434 [Aspergillus granulosus]|uniref:Uncharacterized protein n=1 Tax=Aspergillus granulosus TaxID=176169 RepID=A0ABR4H097_9EURO
MPPMPAKEYRSRHRLAEDLGIEFLGPLEGEAWLATWPETRRQLFHDIYKLGYSQFGTFEGGDSTERPWRAQIKARAAKLAYLAARCRKEGKNESSWRASLEHEVLYRFTVEVSCPTCRDRLWRSEIEAAVESNDAQALSLEERRKHRMPCRCPAGLGHNPDFHGVNMIFSDRAETSIHYDPPLPIQSHSTRKKKYEKPDRVYGLIETQNFKALLDATDKRVSLENGGKSLRDTLEASPFKNDRKPLLFPFLLIEAKSDAVGDSAGVEMQSAFAIRRLLTIQDELRAATRAESKWLTGPLVWFFGWHGQDWYIKASFVDDATQPSPKYFILDLWQGNICRRSSALQLLLIVDYIFDWARDGYRPAIIGELTILAAAEMQLFDSDIFSTIARRHSHNESQFRSFSQDTLRHIASETEDEKATVDFPYVDTRLSLGVVRDASLVESQCLSLHITEANVEAFWLSLTAPDTSNSVLQTILQCLESSWRVTSDTLAYIQAAWTGTSQRACNGTLDETFYIKIVLLWHIADDWSLVRQLTCLAISEGAIQILLSRARLPNSAHSVESRIRAIPTVEKSEIEPFITSIKRQSVVSNLTAAVGMLCLSSSYTRGNRIRKEWLLQRSKNVSIGFVLDSSPSALELVHGLYDAHNKMLGNDPPPGPSYVSFLRSKTSQPSQDTDCCRWPRLDSICRNRNGCALVDGLNVSGHGARYCLYIISRYDFGGSSTPDAVNDLAKEGLYYSTLQFDPRSRRLRECFKYLNRSTKAGPLWQNASSLDILEDWIEGLKSQPKRTGVPGETPNSPIMISSGEESEGDPMEEN